MGANERYNEIRISKDLAEALPHDPEAAATWDALPEAHRRGHVIAIRRAADAEARAERIEHTIKHLFEKHAS